MQYPTGLLSPGEGEWPSAPDAYDDFSGSKAAGSWGGEG